jgi:hypothetical protein
MNEYIKEAAEYRDETQAEIIQQEIREIQNFENMLRTEAWAE